MKTTLEWLSDEGIDGDVFDMNEVVELLEKYHEYKLYQSQL